MNHRVDYECPVDHAGPTLSDRRPTRALSRHRYHVAALAPVSAHSETAPAGCKMLAPSWMRVWPVGGADGQALLLDAFRSGLAVDGEVAASSGQRQRRTAC
jgi:hypothetical protein